MTPNKESSVRISEGLLSRRRKTLIAPFGILLDAFGSLRAPFVLPLARFGTLLAPTDSPLGARRLTFAHLRAPFSHIRCFLASFWINFLNFQQNLKNKSLFFQSFLQISRLQHLFSWTQSRNLPQAKCSKFVLTKSIFSCCFENT